MDITLHEILRLGLTLAGAGVFVWTVSVLGRHYVSGSFPVRFASMRRALGIRTDHFDKLGCDAHLPTAARLCDRCSSKTQCDAWLADRREAGAAPAFCPNAQFLNFVAGRAKTVDHHLG